MDIRTGIIEAARALGINPVDLATAISYETAGTFDPMKRGPTTQWGQHQGLIQFGEPQRAENGVDMSSPEAALASQLGADGAVVRYLRRAGVKPGMGMMDVYSAINAGAPGRYNASDANNGGAPGTVADKVNEQMAGHRSKALALLGGKYNTSSGGADAGQAANAARPVEKNPLRLEWAYRNGKMSPEDAAMYERGKTAGFFAPPAPAVNPLDIYRQVTARPQQRQPMLSLAPENDTMQFPGLRG